MNTISDDLTILQVNSLRKFFSNSNEIYTVPVFSLGLPSEAH